MPFLSIPSPTVGFPSAPPVAGERTTDFGKDEFLALFIAKLANQNPLEPMEDSEFIGQMAQFTQLEQLTNMNALLEKSLNQSTLMTQSLTNTMAPNLIGRNVRVESNGIVLGEEGDAEIRFDLEAAAADVVVEIYGESGSLVRSLRLDGRPKGISEISWDGKDSNGERLPAGGFSLKIRATDSDGDAIGSRSYFSGTVDGVRFIDGMSFLSVNDAYVPMSNVIEVFAE